LIVEFVQRHAAGKSVLEAAMEGAARFRPILMTSFAFIAGLLPLVFATGPGKIGNRTIGTAAAGGMLIGTICICYSWLVLHLWSNRREIQAGKSEEENPLTEEIDNNEVHK
jgi:HAE1 family hydrophobic/amphiphilic exporter-1